MGLPAIRVEGLGKRYRLVHGQERVAYKTLRDSVMNFVASPFKRKGSVEEFWALSDVSFEVQPGEVVGIIGRNGAGKSTLLKVLSRITKPTTGRVEINGRVGSLLEVGTGFHPELTGRENIYLNGSILGMSHKEISKKFDEIVAFAEVEKFLDTPVKRYSSGMYVRLAFAVAAHLEPEILIVDEVLAVGDAAFQEKCIGKMQHVASCGRTVLFVSHQLGSLRKLCTRGVVFEAGRVGSQGRIEESLSYYLKAIEQNADTDLLRRTDRKGNGQVRLTGVTVRQTHTSNSLLVAGGPAQIDFECDHSLPGLNCIFTIYTSQGQPLLSFNSRESGTGNTRESSHQNEATEASHQEGACRFTWTTDHLLLLPGRYRVNVALLCDGGVADHVEGCSFFDVLEGALDGHVLKSSTHSHLHHPHVWMG